MHRHAAPLLAFRHAYAFPCDRQHDPRGAWVTMQAHKRSLSLVSTFLFMALCQSEEDIPRASAKQLRLWKKFYVATGGESWRHCSDAYHDPCSCSSGRRFVRCDSGGWITHIHLFNNGMRGTLPPTLGSFKRLVELFVYENELIGVIPESIDSYNGCGNFHSVPILLVANFQRNLVSAPNFRCYGCTTISSGAKCRQNGRSLATWTTSTSWQTEA